MTTKTKPGSVIEAFADSAYAKLRGARQAAPVKNGPWEQTSPAGKKRLQSHLEDTYGIRVTKMSPIDSGFVVQRSGGAAWVARVFAPARPIDVVKGDAEILQFLEDHDFPAERLVHKDALTMIGDFAVLVTEFIAGGHMQPSGPVVHRLGELTGIMHTLPVTKGSVARPAGSWHALSLAGGARRADVEALLPLLADAQQVVPKEQRGLYDTLREELESIDHCEDLPQAMLHIDFGGPNVIDNPERGLVGIDWAGAGTGPRVFALTALLWSGRTAGLLEAFVAGYRQHVKLEPDELSRLGKALTVHSLILDCWGAAFRPDRVTQLVAGRPRWHEAGETMAARAREAFAAKKLSGWQDVAPPAPNQDAFQILIDAVNGKTDDQIKAFADAIGGYPTLCRLVFQGMTQRLKPPQDCNVGFILGDDIAWVFRSSKGQVTVAKRVAKRAGAIVRSSPADFLRVMTEDISWDDALAGGRVSVEGDEKEVDAMFAGRPA